MALPSPYLAEKACLLLLLRPTWNIEWQVCVGGPGGLAREGGKPRTRKKTLKKLKTRKKILKPYTVYNIQKKTRFARSCFSYLNKWCPDPGHHHAKTLPPPPPPHTHTAQDPWSNMLNPAPPPPHTHTALDPGSNMLNPSPPTHTHAHCPGPWEQHAKPCPPTRTRTLPWTLGATC